MGTMRTNPVILQSTGEGLIVAFAATLNPCCRCNDMMLS